MAFRAWAGLCRSFRPFRLFRRQDHRPVTGGYGRVNACKLAPPMVAEPLPVQAFSAKAVDLPRLAHETAAAAVLWSLAFVVHSSPSSQSSGITARKSSQISAK